MTNLAIKALHLYNEYERLPTDRGGKDGPKGKAWQAFLDAKERALYGTKPMDGTSLLQRIIREVHEQFGCDDPVNERTNFKYDLGADELDMYEIVMWAEEEYRIEITDEELITIDTVGDLECIVREKAKL